MCNKMTSEGEVYLHPNTVEEIVEDLLETDIISKENVSKLKNNVCIDLDPNIIMDIRQREVKKESLIDVISERNIPQLHKRNIAGSLFKPVTKVKNLKTIDMEIANTKRSLREFQSQLMQKNESVTNCMLSIAEVRNNSPLIVSLNEDESKYYFNMQLDCLENSDYINLSKTKEKIWRPYEMKPSPVINVITTMKVINFQQTSTNLKESQLSLLEINENPLNVNGKMLCCSSDSNNSREDSVNIAPNNSPSLEISSSPSINTNKQQEKAIARFVIRKWKQYAENKIMGRLAVDKQFRINLLKQVFTLWFDYVKHCKAKRKATLTTVSTKNKTETNVLNKDKPCGDLVGSKCEDTGNVNRHQTLLVPLLTTSAIKVPIKQESSKVIAVEDANISIKVITPEDVGLMQQNLRKLKESNKIKDLSTKEPKRVSGTKMLPQKLEEPHSHRYAAQEKIISQQLNLIEKQRKLISDLQAKNLETSSKLSLKIAEKQLESASATFHKKLRPVIKTMAAECQTRRGGNRVDNCEKLTNSLLERQEYCRQLSEKTKMRKIKGEDEKARLKLEQEEKLKQEKEEDKKKRLRKLKMEYQSALENAKNVHEIKLKMTVLNEMANNHYNYVLLKKTFNALKRIYSEVHINFEECNKMYEKKLLKRVLLNWNSKMKQSIMFKYESADKFYSTKLLERCWNIWRSIHHNYKIKVQVSEDMFAMKLQERMFVKWLKFTSQHYLETCCKMELAERLCRKQLLRHSFHCWKMLPQLMLVEREKEQRRRAWRQAVQELIPDFSPVFAEKLEV